MCDVRKVMKIVSVTTKEFKVRHLYYLLTWQVIVSSVLINLIIGNRFGTFMVWTSRSQGKRSVMYIRAVRYSRCTSTACS